MLQQELQSLQVFTDSVHGLVLTRILSRWLQNIKSNL
jgi:hypothetical protein